MKAQVIYSYGAPSVFQLIDLPIPTVIPGHVLIRVQATSVNPIDCKVRSGAVPIAGDFPAVLHGDVVGVIEDVGAGVSEFKKGDHVYGCAGGFKGMGGATAQFMLADARLIAKRPTQLSILQCAALPLVCITAWESLFDKVKLQRGDSILIHGGSGGVGHIAVQLAKWAGAKVTVTVRSNDDVEKVKLLGADEVINVREETVVQYKARLTQERGFDIIFDTVGGANLDNSFAAIANNGKIVTIAARSTNDLTPLHTKGASLHCVSMLLPLLTGDQRERFHHILTRISEIADQGHLTPWLDPHTFTLETIADAHQLLESGEAKGKVVIQVAPSKNPQE